MYHFTPKHSSLRGISFLLRTLSIPAQRSHKIPSSSDARHTLPPFTHFPLLWDFFLSL